MPQPVQRTRQQPYAAAQERGELVADEARDDAAGGLEIGERGVKLVGESLIQDTGACARQG